eukprot:m.93626 g.93626  ORF g.93626 m.93626 type:complete len:140 (-) comp13404_c0_seq2:107-526(-)
MKAPNVEQYVHVTILRYVLKVFDLYAGQCPGGAEYEVQESGCIGGEVIQKCALVATASKFMKVSCAPSDCRETDQITTREMNRRFPFPWLQDATELKELFNIAEKVPETLDFMQKRTSNWWHKIKISVQSAVHDAVCPT